MIDSGNTAWLITATALVLFMTVPGLALFYAGLVRSKNVLSVLMQCFAITCLVSLLWLAIGYFFFATQLLKRKLEIDDSLDVSPVHGVGGVLGSLLTGVFAAVSLGGSGFSVQTTIGAQVGV